MTQPQGMVKRDFSFPLQVSIQTRLESAGLLKLDGGAVVVRDFSKTVKLQAFPYVTVGDETTSANRDTKYTSEDEITVQVHIWSQYGGTRECAYIGGQVETALTQNPLDLSADGFQVHEFFREYANTIKEVDGLTVHRVLRFRARMEDTQTVQPH